MFRYYNPNPIANQEEDCSVRALSAALDISWDDAYDLLAHNAKQMGVMMHNDAAWGSVLRQEGFYRKVIPNTCPDCYTVRDFCRDNPYGVFVLKSSGHVATVVDGQLLDSWNSEMNVPQYYWYRPEER